jgi:shikimate kinase
VIAPTKTGSLFLVGFMGAGKTTVGRILSQRFKWPFEDLDDRIEARERRSIAEIFRDYGEEAFRRAETAALQALIAELGSSPRIVALGGGTLGQPENARLVRDAGGTLVFLDSSVDELFRRCEAEQKTRPMRRSLPQFRELYNQRLPFYMTAVHRIDTSGKDAFAVATEVACSLGWG